MKPVSLIPTRGIEGPLADEVEAFNETARAINADLAACEQAVDEACDELADADPKAFAKTRDRLQAERFAARRRLVDAWQQRGELVERWAAAARERLAEAKERLPEVEAEVLERLEEEGRTPATWPGVGGRVSPSGFGPATAAKEREFFEYVVRTAPAYVEADREVAAARKACTAAKDAERQQRQGLAEACEALARFVRTTLGA